MDGQTCVKLFWMNNAFPENIEELLLDRDLKDDQLEGDAFGRDDETDDDDADDDSQD